MSWRRVAEKLEAEDAGSETTEVEAEGTSTWIRKAARAAGVSPKKLREVLKGAGVEGPADAYVYLKLKLKHEAKELPWKKGTVEKICQKLKEMVDVWKAKITANRDEAKELAEAFPPSFIAMITPVLGSTVIVAGPSDAGKSLLCAVMQEVSETPSDCRHQVSPNNESPFSAISRVILKYGRDEGMVFREDDVHVNHVGGPAATWLLVETTVLKEGGAIGSVQWGVVPEAIERLKNGAAVVTYQVDADGRATVNERSVNRALVLPYFGVPASQEFKAIFTELRHRVLPTFAELDIKVCERGVRPTPEIEEITKLALKVAQTQGFRGSPTREQWLQPRWVTAKMFAVDGVPVDPEIITNAPREEKEALKKVIVQMTRRLAEEIEEKDELGPSDLRELRDMYLATGELWFVGRFMWEEPEEAAEVALDRLERVGAAESKAGEMLKELC